MIAVDFEIQLGTSKYFVYAEGKIFPQESPDGDPAHCELGKIEIQLFTLQDMLTPIDFRSLSEPEQREVRTQAVGELFEQYERYRTDDR